MKEFLAEIVVMESEGYIIRIKLYMQDNGEKENSQERVYFSII